MHPLLISLAQWPGRRITKASIESLGYFIPQRFEEFACADCANVDSLMKYWDEIALEYVCSAGRALSDRRILSDTSYRSKYLDDLAADRIKGGETLDGFPLDDCYRNFNSMMRSSYKENLPYLEWLEVQMRRYKLDEIDSFGISAKNWTGTKKEFSVYLANICEERGFELKNKKWRKIFDPLEISCAIDGAMKRTWTFQLPLKLTMVHRDKPDLIYCFALADDLMPGFHYYRRYREPEEAILGVQAHVDLFNLVGELIIN